MSNPKALLIDDDRDYVKLFTSLAGGWDVDSVGTVDEGIKEAVSSDYDLLIIDVKLPDGSGIDLAKHLLQTKPTAKIAIISGAITAQLASGLLSDFKNVKFFEKPIRRSTVTAILNERTK